MNYLDRAKYDLEAARIFLTPIGNPNNDEGLYDIAAYHVQQSIEKALKHILHDLCKMDDDSKEFKTHNIVALIRKVENTSDFDPSDNIRSKAVKVTTWEAKSRYNAGSVATRNEIADGIRATEELIKKISEWTAMRTESEKAEESKNESV